MPDPLAIALGPLGLGERKMDELPVPRFVEFAMNEVPNSQELKPGSSFVVPIGFIVKAINDEGKILANVTSVNGQSPMLSRQEQPDISVSTQQSNSP